MSLALTPIEESG